MEGDPCVVEMIRQIVDDQGRAMTLSALKLGDGTVFSADASRGDDVEEYSGLGTDVAEAIADLWDRCPNGEKGGA